MKKAILLTHLFLMLIVFDVYSLKYVKVVASGTGDGSSWANAAGLSDIQTMISADSAAIAGTSATGEIRFAAGKYILSSTILLRNGVNLTGGYSADGSVYDLSVYKAVLDGNNTIRIINSVETSGSFSKITTVDGFVIQRGFDQYGSAVAMNAGVVLQNCIVRNNYGTNYGAAIFMKKNTTGSAVSGALINCQIVNNTADNSLYKSNTVNVGGVFVADSSPFSMINCVVANNQCLDANTSTITNYGVGGLYISGANSVLANCQLVNTIFYNNKGSAANNVKVNNSLAMPNLYNNWFSDNANPFVNANNSATSLSNKGNKTAANVANAGFANPCSFIGSQTANSDTIAIYSAGWALSSTSGLLDTGISKDIIYPYSIIGGSTNRLYTTLTTDIAGNSRVNSTPDLGMYEFTPVTVTTVNPNAIYGSVTPTAQVCKGSPTTITASPNAGYGFLNWTNTTTSAIVSTNAAYTFTATANVSLTANFVSITTVKMTTPSFARSATAIDLVWKAPSFAGTVTYKVLDSNNAVIQTGISGLSCHISGLLPNSSYAYKVIALSGAFESQVSNSVTATTRKAQGTNYELIDDFETTALSGWSAVYGATCTYGIVNPTKLGINMSAKCAQISILANADNDGGYKNANERIEIGPSASFKYLHLKFKKTADIGSLNLTLSGRSDTTQTDYSPAIALDYTTKMTDGDWYDYVFDMRTASITNQVHFGFIIKPNKTHNLTNLATTAYIDDMFLSNDLNPLNSNLTTVAVNVSSNNVSMGSVSGGGNCLKSQLTTVSAAAIVPYHFYNWTENGVEVSFNPVYSFSTTAARTLVANFQNLYVVTTVSNNTAKGTVSAGGSYTYGATVTATATVKSGYTFQYWTENDTIVSTNPVYIFTLKTDRRLKAIFITATSISASPNNVLYGAVTGSGIHDLGESLTLIAAPKVGYVFSNWSENGTIVSKKSSYNFTVSTPRTLVANFVQLTSDVANYNYCVGNSNIGAAYGFTGQDFTLDASQAMEAMGENMTKLSLSKDFGGNNYASYEELLKLNPVFKSIFDASFTRYFCWVQGTKSWSVDTYTPAEQASDSLAMFNLTKYLIQTYNNSGKTFYLGNWEGDWMFTHLDATFEASDLRCESFIKWARARQNGVDAAKALYPHSNVQVYYYVEVNRSVDAKEKGLRRLINMVIPYTNVDYVSYSSYDFQDFPQVEYNALLDYVLSKVPAKPGIPGKRVFIGEMGHSYNNANYSGAEHDRMNRNIFVKALNWGCPYALYWGMQDDGNIGANGVKDGWWLITDKNEKTPLYYTLANLYQSGKQWVTDYKTSHGVLPPIQEYQAWAARQLATTPVCLVTTERNDTLLGTVTTSKVYDTGVSATVTAFPKTGCKFLKWSDGNSDVSTNASYTFTTSSDITLTAYFSNISTVENPTENAVKLKYNPINSGILLLEGKDIHQVIIYNAMGQQLFNGNYQQGIDISNYPCGVYIGRVTSEYNKLSIIRFVKK